MDATITQYALRQWGVVTRAQALYCGLTDTAIKGRVRTGRWRQLHRGVYVVGGAPASFEQAVLGACFAVGSALASHRCAATLWGLEPVERKLEVITTHGRYVELPGVVVHRTRHIDVLDQAAVAGVPLTTPTRTLIDLASTSGRHRMELLLHHALVNRQITLDGLWKRMDQIGRRGRPGVRLLSSLLLDTPQGWAKAESTFEIDLLALIRRGGLPPPVPQYEDTLPSGRRVRFDAAYPPPIWFAIECQSFRRHGSSVDWSSDVTRGAEATAYGWRILPVTYRDVRKRPEWVLAQVRKGLAFAKLGSLSGP